MAKKALLRDHDNIEILPITRGELVLDSSGKVALHSNEFLASNSRPGLMSAEDKAALTSLAGGTIDSDLSTTSINPVQNKVVTNAINSIKTSYLKSATVSTNTLTIVDQNNKETKFYNTTYGVVTQAADGLAPKLGTKASATIGTQADEWVLTSTKGSAPTWRKLPVNAFKNDNNNTTYTFASGNGGFTVTPSGGTAQFVSIGYIDGQYINKLTGYTKATTIAALVETDTLNTALGKLELKADVAYNLVKGAYDGDGTIENLAEILKVLEGIKDTETIQAIIGKYLPLTGGTLTNDNNILNLSGTTNSYIYYRIGSTNKASSGYYENFAFIANEKTYARIGVADDGTPQYHTDNHKTNVYTLLHSGIAYINNGTITINGVSLTPLTNLPSHAHDNYLPRHTYTIPKGKSVRITFAGQFNAIIYGRCTLGNGSLILIGNGYGENRIRNSWTQLSTGSISWSVPNSDSYSNTIEIQGRSDHPVDIEILSKVTPTFIEISALTSSIMDDPVALRSQIPTKLSQLTNDLGFVVGGPYLPTAGGTMLGEIRFNITGLLYSDISTGIKAAFKAPRVQANELIANYIYLGASSGAKSNLPLVIRKYDSVSSQAPASVTDLVTINTDGNIKATNLWSIVSITKSIKLTKDWQDTGIVINDTTFPDGSGTYAVQVFINAGESIGFWYSLFSGVASFQTLYTNGTEPDDEILLHHSSHGCSKQIYLKTKPTSGGQGYYNKLYIACNSTCSTAVNVVFKFKKLI